MTAIGSAPRRRAAARLVLLLSLAGATAGAQVIGGRAVDPRTRLPLRSIAVVVLGDSGRVMTATKTDTSGVFYANLPSGGRYRVRFVLDSVSRFDTDTMSVGAEEFYQREFLVTVPRVYFEFQVEKQVQMIAGRRGPQYPADMKAARISGEVLAQFVVDSSGAPRVDTFKALRSTNESFTKTVMTWLLTARFVPAEIGGVHVPQMVQQPFTFSVPRAPPLQADTSAWPPPMTRPRP